MNILLVDDNIYILEGIQAGIDCASLGFTEVFTARSMAKAVEILENHSVDVVLSDIEMPNGTGLELLEWINGNQPNVVTLFCTSYANFDYAKKALELHCFEYYLKPIQWEELYLLLEKAVGEVERRRAQREQSRLGDYWRSNLAELKNHFWADALLQIDAYSEEELVELAKSRYLEYREEDLFTVAIFHFQGGRLHADDMSFSIQQFVLNNIFAELMEGEQLSVEGLLKVRPKVWALVAGEPPELSESSVRSILERIFETAEEALGCTLTACFDRGVQLEKIRGHYLALEEAVLGTALEKGRIYHLRELEKPVEQISAGEQDSAIEKVRAYIDAHYSEEISREAMGSLVYHNTEYLARLFKQKTGQSLGGYLIERRMERAKELLRETELSVSDVALAVGYDNFAYFSRLFKKKTGQAPSDYKKK